MVRVTACLHDAIVAVIGRATDHCGRWRRSVAATISCNCRSHERSLRRSHRTNTQPIECFYCEWPWWFTSTIWNFLSRIHRKIWCILTRIFYRIFENRVWPVTHNFPIVGKLKDFSRPRAVTYIEKVIISLKRFEFLLLSLLIGSDIWPMEQHRFRWPSVAFNGIHLLQVINNVT